MLDTLFFVYLQNVLFLAVLFAGFRAITQTGFSLEAFNFSKTDLKIILTTPVAYLVIGFFASGMFASLLNIIAFITIYAYFTGNLKKY